MKNLIDSKIEIKEKIKKNKDLLIFILFITMIASVYFYQKNKEIKEYCANFALRKGNNYYSSYKDCVQFIKEIGGIDNLEKIRNK